MKGTDKNHIIRGNVSVVFEYLADKATLTENAPIIYMTSKTPPHTKFSESIYVRNVYYYIHVSI